MNEVEQARAEVETHRQGLRKVEEELRAALAEKEELEPSGLFGLFASSPDPQRLEELAAIIEVLKEEHRLRRVAFNQALRALEQAEVKQSRPPAPELPVDDLDQATAALQGLKHIEKLVDRLRSMASKATRARETVRVRPAVGDRDRWESQRSVAQAARQRAVEEHTLGWDALVDEAELVADMIGMPLILTRRRPPEPRDPGAPSPAADVDLARKQSVNHDEQAFGLALDTMRTELDRVQRTLWELAEDVKARFPDAAARAAGRPFDLAPAPSSTDIAPSSPESDIATHWAQLRQIYDVLVALADRGARTVDFLDPMGRWQRHAQAVAALPFAQAHDLVPPVNEGGPLPAFIASLRAVWPELDARYIGAVNQQRT